MVVIWDNGHDRGGAVKVGEREREGGGKRESKNVSYIVNFGLYRLQHGGRCVGPLYIYKLSTRHALIH